MSESFVENIVDLRSRGFKFRYVDGVVLREQAECEPTIVLHVPALNGNTAGPGRDKLGSLLAHYLNTATPAGEKAADDAFREWAAEQAAADARRKATRKKAVANLRRKLAAKKAADDARRTAAAKKAARPGPVDPAPRNES